MKKILAALAALPVLAVPALAQAQSLDQLRDALFPAIAPPTDINTLFLNIFRILITIAAIIAIFYLIWAGISYITASTDEEKAKKARMAIYNAIIGIVVIILSYIIIIWLSNLIKQQVQPGLPFQGFQGGGFNAPPGTFGGPLQ